MTVKLYLVILFFCFSDSINARVNNKGIFLSNKDTIIQNPSEKNKTITKNSSPQSEVIDIGNFTHTGFKNLFLSSSYNPSLPYSSQMNPHAEWFMHDYLLKQGKYLINMKSWGLPYFNLIDHILQQHGLPKELKYLAVIESGLQTSSTSWVGAAGPWQFMPETGIAYGLVVNRELDERRDFIKSTHAAAKYLLDLFKEFKDWLLVIAAYNCGDQRVKNVIRKTGTKDFWKIQYNLPTETRNHVKKFIATHYIMEANPTNEKLFSADQNNNTEDANLQTKNISGKYCSNVIAKYLSMNLNEFNKYNPNFDNDLHLNGDYLLKLPIDRMKVFEEKRYSILNECIQILLQ